MNKRLLLLLAVLLLASPLAVAQSSHETDGDASFAAGLYKQALDSYKKAARSHRSPDLIYKMAEASRMANNYTKAIDYYKEIATSINRVDYPDCFYYLGMMYKCNGQVDSAAHWINRYLSSLPDNKALMDRARQESRACEWILDKEGNHQKDIVYGVVHESKNINTANSESGAVLVGDSLLLFSSIQEFSSVTGKNAIDFDLVLMQVYESPVTINGKAAPSVLNNWGINHKESHSGNVAIDSRNSTIYFTRSTVGKGKNNQYNTITSSIYCIRQKKGKWQKAQKLGGDINLDGYTSTQPAVAYLEDGSTILYFSSNRPQGQGGFDIWYSVISPDGTPSKVVNAGPIVNTPGDEITPFYCNECQRLYFSSDWHFGYGGQDVFYSLGSRDQWQEPVNLGPSLNSPANDIYFTVNEGSPNKGYFTSNRRGSYFISDNTCCNDIYRWNSKPAPVKKEEPVKEHVVTMKGAVHSLLPISLYFHNDTPDPKSELFTTKETYFQTYNRYMFMRQQYKNAFSSMKDTVARDSILNEVDYFFDHDVHDNCVAFEKFINLLIDDLKAGKRVNITVEGYASPVHNSKYNQKISQRRVGSIVNQLMEYDHGRLKPYLGSKGEGSLRISEVAYGSSRAKEGVSADGRNTAQSVYSVDASRERRIEILDYTYLEDDSTKISCLNIPVRASNIGSFDREKVDIQVRIPHTSLNEATLDFISVGSPDAQVISYSKLTPRRDLVVYLRLDFRKSDPTPQSFLPLTIRVKGEQVTQTMFLEYSVK